MGKGKSHEEKIGHREGSWLLHQSLGKARVLKKKLD